MSQRGNSLRLTNLGKQLSSQLLFSPSAQCKRVFSSKLSRFEKIAAQCEYFEYTSGRWIFNEHVRLAERRLPFNYDELMKAAAKSVNKDYSDVKSFHKFAEGGFNRVFETLMTDGSSVYARLPYPSTVPRRFAIASEVATLAFLRAQGIPVPRVLGYDVDENAVGVEYMLLEKMPGKPLGALWLELSEKQRHKVLAEIVELETKLFAIKLPASGSIYFDRDLAPGTPRMSIPGSPDGLCVGPYAALEWWFEERGALQIDRGPHEDSHVALAAAAEREMAWIRAHGRPRFPFQRPYRETFDFKKQDPEVHLRSLTQYMQIASYLVPTSSALNQPVLRHPELQPDNIFVSEDLTITGLIDWQHAVVLPTFLACGIPKRFEAYIDEESFQFTIPKPPENLDSMDEDQRSKAQEEFRRRHIHFWYLGFTGLLNEPHWHALEQPTTRLQRRIFEHASRPWTGINTPLQLDLLQIQDEWSNIARPNQDGTIPACPLSINEDEAAKIKAENASLVEADTQMETLEGILGITREGWVSNEVFENVKEGARIMKEVGLDGVADEPWLQEMSARHWFFDDGDEDE